MPENKDFLFEQERINRVIDEIDHKISLVEAKGGALKHDVVSLRKTFWDDVTVNLDEPDDVIETHTSLRQQSELLSERERSHGLIHKQLANLQRLKVSPYFGRIDFQEIGEEKSEDIYIGLFSLMDEEDEDFLVYDWRAPISSMYYDYAPGPVKYRAMDETITGEMTLKRQYIIRNGKLKGMFDTGMTIGDEMLQEVLSNQANPQMKNIVATIQKEQNEIIRNNRKKYLVVRGAAGSGKTSAALQRVAFLLYQYREKLQADNILLFSPNQMFNSYVATVLPELGEENMQQSTFFQYLSGRIQNEFMLEDPFSQMEYMLGVKRDGDYYSRQKGIQFKASLSYKNLMDTYIDYLSNEGMTFKNIVFRNEVFITSEEITAYFYQLDKNISIPNRITLVKDWLLEQLALKEKDERKQEWVEEERELLGRAEYLKVYKKLQKEQRFTEDTFDDQEREEILLNKWLVRRRIKPLKRKINQLAFLDVPKIYQNLFQWPESQDNMPAYWDEIAYMTIENLKNKELLYEDATPFLYLKDKLEGRKSFMNIRHVIIDEAQDYSPFQFAYLKMIFPYSQMTILGDVNQSIFTHSVNNQSGLEKVDELFAPNEVEEIRLTKSYRSTKQIIQFAEDILKGNNKIEPFNRNGEKPSISVVENKAVLHNTIVTKVKSLLDNGHQTIAIITKTEQEAADAYRAFEEYLPLHLVKKETNSYEKGVLIIPTYLAKGIEFDAVIIYNCSNDVYVEDDERTVLYTACTRAMHELYLFSLGEKSALLNDVDKNKYRE
ncbi:RNA polymerase recycling motor HelD [Oceanobacillus bengalensis]|uniref:Helicase n=1 Tax=Oceanobacillus bengalensis TaxID=1435466 RepID=A0A494YR78_9BACI|nr:RNA polymerase recycling motor HelD [Oceanobacillus bengalensis]RKQ11504.1 helicase [Oceanobacillus bengalensis]